MNEQPKDYASDSGDGVNHNTAPVAQAIVKFIERTPSWVYLMISVIAAVLAVAMWLDVRRMSDSFDDVRRMLESAQGAALDSVRDAALAAERADKAERGAKLAEVMARQVFVELNRLGYPVLTSAEPHPLPPPENDH